jgi:hypothetical protein
MTTWGLPELAVVAALSLAMVVWLLAERRALALVVLLLLLLPAAAHAQGLGLSLSPDLSGGARPATYSGAVDWSRSWAADWGASAAGMPAPTIACEAAASGGDMTCTGATATKVGSPVTVPAAGYPERWAARLDGAQNFTLGNIDAPAGSFRICGTVTTSTLTGSGYLWAKDDTNTKRSVVLWRNGATLTLTVFKASGGTSAKAIGTMVAGDSAAFCAAYVFVADGSSVIRGNFNGTATTDLTNGVGPVATNDAVLAVGSSSVNTGRWSGDVASLVYTESETGNAAADLAVYVASQQARLAAKPLGSLVTVTSGPTTCEGASGALYNLPAGSLCPAADGSGVLIYGAAQHGNLLTYSNTFENAAWTKDDGVTASDANAGCPLGPLGTRMALITGDADGEGISDDEATGTGRGIWLAYPTGGSACNVTVSDASGDGAAAVALTAAAVRTVQSGAGQTGIKIAKPTGGCAAWCQQAASVQASLIVGPYVPTAGLAATGVADAPTVEAQTITDAAGCIGAKFTAPSGAAANSRVIGAGVSALTPLYLKDSTLTSIGFYDSTTATGLTVPSMAGREVAAASCWSGTSATIYSLTDGLSAPAAYDGTWLPAGRVLHIGSQSATASHINGAVRCVCQASTLAGIKKCFARECP